MLRIYICILALLFCVPGARAQQIQGMEYAFDTDPGPGNGTYVPLTPAAAVDFVHNFNTSALGLGVHKLILRFKDTSGLWGAAQYGVFFLTPGTNNFATPVITAFDYYLDSANSTHYTYSLPTGTQQFDDTVTLSFPGVPPGMHTLYIRTGNNDLTGHYVARTIYLTTGNGNGSDSLPAMEVFFDTDPGFGSGIPIALNAAPAVDTTVSITVPNLSLGNHMMYVRAKDNTGNWSQYQADTVRICPNPPPVAGFDKVRFGSTFSFIDTSKYAESYLWDFGDGTTDSVSNPLHQFPHPGVFTVKQRVTNACHFAIDSTIIVIEGIEYYTPTSSGKGNCIFEVFGGNLDTNIVFKLTDSLGNVYVPYGKAASENGSYYTCLVDFHSANIGNYTVEIQTEDSTYIYPNGFFLEEYKPALRVQVLGRETVRVLTQNLYTVRVHNDGNTVAGSALLSLYIPDGTIVTRIDSILLSDTAIALGGDTLSEYLSMTTANGYITDGKLYQYMVYNIPPGGYEDLTFNLQFWPGSKSIYANVAGPYSGSPWFNWMDECWRAKAAFGYNLLTGLAMAIPVADCGLSIMKFHLDPFILTGGILLTKSIDGPAATRAIASVKRNLVGIISNCAGEATGIGIGVELAFDLALVAYDANEGLKNIYKNCPEKSDVFRKFATVVGAIDPNAIYGPSGFGEPRFIKGDKALDYSISFENVDSATLSAQKVVVIDTLDGNVFDLSTFELGGFSIGTKSFYIPTNRKEYASNYRLDSANSIRANFKFDTLTGVLTCSFFSIDSIGEIVDDPLVGFLPPNTLPPNGEGSVYYSVGLKESLPDGTIIPNKASIVFDENPAIETEPWINTLDIRKPESSIATATIENDTVVRFSINGNDLNGSQIYYYNLYVSKDGQPYEDGYRILNNGIFRGAYNSEYSFYVEGIDSVGNRESKDPIAEATITIQPTSIAEVAKEGSAFRVFPNPTTGMLNIAFSRAPSASLQVNIFDLTGKLIGSKALRNHAGKAYTLRLDELSSGMYFVEILEEGNQSLGRQKIVLVK